MNILFTILIVLIFALILSVVIVISLLLKSNKPVTRHITKEQFKQIYPRVQRCYINHYIQPFMTDHTRTCIIDGQLITEVKHVLNLRDEIKPPDVWLLNVCNSPTDFLMRYIRSGEIGIDVTFDVPTKIRCTVNEKDYKMFYLVLDNLDKFVDKANLQKLPRILNPVSRLKGIVYVLYDDDVITIEQKRDLLYKIDLAIDKIKERIEDERDIWKPF